MARLELILQKGADKPAAGGWWSALKTRLQGRNVMLRIGLLLLLLAIVASAVVAYAGPVGGLVLVIVIVAIPTVHAIVVYPRFGIMTVLVVGHFIMYIIKFVPTMPLGTVIDGIELLLVLGFFIQQKKENNWQVLKSPLTIIMLVWIGYNFAQAFNPWAESVLAWVYTVRSVAIIMLMYFIFIYHVRTIDFIRLIIKLWLILSFVGAVYAVKQQIFGYSDAEFAFVNADPTIAQLLFIGGEWRKFSIFSDPVTFSYNMVISSLLCIGLLTGPFSRRNRIILGCLAAFFMYVMMFSGTRGAYVLIPVTMLLFAILKYSKKIMMIMLGAALFLVFLIFVPTSNLALYRFQTAFTPSNDPSFNVRKENQKRIQPYILTHPMGGGLGATGVWGVRFAPYSYLAQFPPDSGYVRVAVEMGWVGLFIFCFLMFSVLKTGINNYYRIRSPELKSYCLAMTLIVFALNIGNYPQEALVQFPSNIYFYLVSALIVITGRIDKDLLPQNNLAATTGETIKPSIKSL